MHLGVVPSSGQRGIWNSPFQRDCNPDGSDERNACSDFCASQVYQEFHETNDKGAIWTLLPFGMLALQPSEPLHEGIQ